jgi:phosphonate transport system substrate-binding protein
MKTKNFIRLLFIFTALSFTSVNSFANEKGELLFGSVAMDIPAAMHKRLKPLTQVAEKKVTLAYLTPVAYLKAHKKGGAKIIAKTVTKGKASFQLMIVVKEDSPIKTVADLKGKTFAFGDEKALLQRAAVVGAGVKMEDFSEYKFIGHYDNIARGVKNGDFDAGILKDTKAFKWEGKGLRILAASPDLPPYNIAANGDVSDELLAKLKKAFLGLDPKNPEHLKVIKAVAKKYTGFAATNDAEYDVVRKLIKPFNK